MPFNNIISRGDVAGLAAERTEMAERRASAKSDAGADQAQHKMDEWNAQGFKGVAVDPTPNEAYTVAGVTGKPDPTPETDQDAEAAAREAAGIGHGPLAAAAREASITEEAASGDTQTSDDE